MKVAELMTSDVVTVGVDDPLVVADELMGLRGFRHMPVVDATGKLLGLLNRVDMLRALVAVGASDHRQLLVAKSKLKVRDIMTAQVVVVSEETTVVEAGQQMRSTHHSCLPVVRDGMLVGLITEADFVRLALQLLDNASV